MLEMKGNNSITPPTTALQGDPEPTVVKQISASENSPNTSNPTTEPYSPVLQPRERLLKRNCVGYRTALYSTDGRPDYLEACRNVTHRTIPAVRRARGARANTLGFQTFPSPPSFPGPGYASCPQTSRMFRPDETPRRTAEAIRQRNCRRSGREGCP